MTGMMAVNLFLLLSGLVLCPQALAQDESGALPDHRLTHGHALALTTAELCKRYYKSPARKIPIELKCRVFARYHINKYDTGYNVDHLIPPRLGGSNEIENLWPQPLASEWGWQRKNKLERRLRKMVCSGRLDLLQAQQEFATHWINAYKKYVGEPRQQQTDLP